MARRATAADAALVANLWNSNLAAIQAGWPEFLVPTTPGQAEAEIVAEDVYINTRPPNRANSGYFRTRAEELPAVSPNAGQPGHRLVIWVVQAGLPQDQLTAVLTDLFRGWFADHVGERCWGTVPRSIAPRSIAHLEQQGWQRTDYPGDGGTWSLYEYVP